RPRARRGPRAAVTAAGPAGAPESDDGPVRVAVAQTSATADPARNLASALEVVSRAAAAGARLVVLPEYAQGYDRGPRVELAEPLDGPFVSALAAAAATHGIQVCAGTTVPEGDRAANVVVLLDADGTL